MSNTRQYKLDFSIYQSPEQTARQQGEPALELCTELLRLIFGNYQGPAAIRLWDGRLVVGSQHASCALLFKEQYPLRALFLKKDLTSLVDAYLAGDIDLIGDAEQLFTLVDYLQGLSLSLKDHVKLLIAAVKLPRSASTKSSQQLKSDTHQNSRHAISHHYDVGNDFYRLFLDPGMIYSCGYFSDAQESVAAAQKDKLDHICRKLRLEPGMQLLDIGCGWGGLAIHAAQNYGVNVHGITLSQQQYDYAREKIAELELEDRIKIELRDYRDLAEDGYYDRIVSVGMFEHIGVRNFPVYFSLIQGLLKPDGLFLNHGITNDSGWDDSPERQFVNDYIFPDGELTRISTVITSMEDAGFEIADVECLRPHYVLTLRKWIKALRQNREEAVRVAGDAKYRLWELYMAGSAYYFDHGNTGIYQVLATQAGEAWPLPLRRDDLYRQ